MFQMCGWLFLICSGKIIKHGFTKGNKQKYKAYEDIENTHN